MTVTETRNTAADAIRRAVELADDAAEYGADLAESGVSATIAVSKGIVTIPTSYARKLADLLDGD